MRQQVQTVFLIAALLVLAACSNTGAAPSLNSTPTLMPTLDQAASAVRDVVPQPTEPSPTPQAANLRIWWPDDLYPVDNSTASSILSEQIEGFRDTYSNLGLDVRRKRASGLGGILSTLRTAAPVAPSAMPDLTLMQRGDMIAAASEGLIIPINDWVASDVLNNLPANVRALGEIDGTLYGVPYALNLFHVVYRAALLANPPLSFEDVLEQQPRFRFSAGVEPGNSVNWTILLQYLAADGRLVDENNNPVLDEGPLMALLEFYAQGVEQGIFDNTLLNNTQVDSYWNSFSSGETSMMCLDTRTYLTRKDGVPNVGLAPLPTADGNPLTALEGWMWVLTTHDPDRQDQAATFLSWIMRVNAQAVYLEALGLLPSQQQALSLWDDQDYATFAQTMLTTAQIVPMALRNSSAAAALQLAVASVLEGAPAQDAAAEALAKFAVAETTN
ncbi:MAG TPA: extracellular solute-binding protein [Aggregatilineaceae bacterium]|nr:extracellular solute-binding protein [Aggregatilineaceae bacterium]